MKNFPRNIANGQGGVYRVVAELIARGHVPYLPVVDTGIDILLGSGIRLQVKTTQRETQHWRFPGSWSFSLQRSQRIVGQQYIKCAARKYSEHVDFVILHAAEAKRYWIVPAHVLDGRHTVLFKDGRKLWKEFDIAEARRLRDEMGWSYQQIAEHFGAVDHHTIMRRLKGEEYSTLKRKNIADIPQYEDRWDLIEAALATLREANHVVTQSADSTAPEQPAEGSGSRISG